MQVIAFIGSVALIRMLVFILVVQAVAVCCCPLCFQKVGSFSPETFIAEQFVEIDKNVPAAASGIRFDRCTPCRLEHVMLSVIQVIIALSLLSPRGSFPVSPRFAVATSRPSEEIHCFISYLSLFVSMVSHLAVRARFVFDLEIRSFVKFAIRYNLRPVREPKVANLMSERVFELLGVFGRHGRVLWGHWLQLAAFIDEERVVREQTYQIVDIVG